MSKLKISLFTLLFSIFILASPVSAINNPLERKNNPFGIHIFDENDLEDAANLVNSQGGDWGYVTLVVRSDERDIKRWQKAFDKMRELHLIPIVRIATRITPKGWEKPDIKDFDNWVFFLNSLNWVVQNRYVIFGNEPNHAKEWGGEINPAEYGKFLIEFSQKLKNASSDFFILPAGFDASAPNSIETLDEEVFLAKMISENPNLFDYIDGWTSHSYPNPEFSGSPDDNGRGTIRTFNWELSLLKKIGVSKKLPVFITETGWKHSKEGKENEKEIEEISRNLKAAYELAWNDERIVAVTPFVLNYQETPFDVFSWKKRGGGFYKFYYEIKDLPKPKGNPQQIVAVDVLTMLFPPIIPKDGWLTGVIAIKNTGQSIWEREEKIYTSYKGFEVVLEPKIFSKVRPGEKTLAVAKVRKFRR